MQESPSAGVSLWRVLQLWKLNISQHFSTCRKNFSFCVLINWLFIENCPQMSLFLPLWCPEKIAKMSWKVLKCSEFSVCEIVWPPCNSVDNSSLKDQKFKFLLWVPGLQWRRFFQDFVPNEQHLLNFWLPLIINGGTATLFSRKGRTLFLKEIRGV